MSTSLVITTYNWERALDRVLGSVAEQTLPPDEVVIADDGSGPGTRDVVAAWIARLGVPLIHVWQEDRGFRLSASRNRALAAAHGDYVIMVDGDMILHRRFVESHVRFARDGTYVQGGRAKIREPLTHRILAGERVRLGFFAKGVGTRQQAIHLPLASRFYRGRRGVIDGTQGCNLAFWMSDARRVNGFNEDIEGWGYDDIEFVARLQNAGVQRRNLKFGGVAFHLFHGMKPVQQHRNRRFLDEVIANRLTRCENGLDKHLRVPVLPEVGGA